LWCFLQLKGRATMTFLPTASARCFMLSGAF
jgi:hypothetical protein